ncbi:aminoglycoside phosphotransferase family protein [Streptomyces sp. H10-C2]|uniref:aminoglycoside phosphotransferase family protein n=1 Tax=unclassified Streptomyces TaxID=2593676 RepID=UPI0024BAEDAF|nr:MULTISPECIES: aminoglycoside phosphotransferase family protein [unclassified Streptomyces]MDJ0342628.1 aminoglycoside phosphotransferase family protein [Streptomyces sp. PH10-H1]MDJ0368518.1 aminoglycoside phosphotransferase family protein [Streptomyces sp. H10-C2]
MTTRTLGDIPSGCRQRLLAHYGPGAQGWLDTAPDLLATAAQRWKLSLRGYVDSGHASVIAMTTDLGGRPLLLKAWVDPDRYRHEVDALRLWAGGPTADVLEAADDLAVASLELVGGRPGGADRPHRETQMVAAALQGLHIVGRRRNRPNQFPRLADYLHGEVLPRIRRREHTLDVGRWRPPIDATLPSLADLDEDPTRTTVLHADLYRENVPFDSRARPRLIDPLPMLGDPAFDWAFWTVYYDLGQGTSARLTAASRVSRIPVPVLAPWCRLLALDGLLFYVETGDPRVPRIAEVLSDLSASTRWSGT